MPSWGPGAATASIAVADGIIDHQMAMRTITTDKEHPHLEARLQRVRP